MNYLWGCNLDVIPRKSGLEPLNAHPSKNSNKINTFGHRFNINPNAQKNNENT
jgi:hypothetical protein